MGYNQCLRVAGLSLSMVYHIKEKKEQNSGSTRP